MKNFLKTFEAIFMLKIILNITLFFIFLFQTTCGTDDIFLSGHIKGALDTIVIPCDPYDQNIIHSCVLFTQNFDKNLLIYDATKREFVLSPMQYFPLKVEIGPNSSLSKVMKAQEKFPHFLALNNSLNKLHLLSSFPHDGQKSFRKPTSFDIAKGSFRFASFLADEDHIVSLISFPLKKTIEFIAINLKTKKIEDFLLKNILLGTHPSHIAIDDDAKFALITDEHSNKIYRVGLDDFLAVLKNNKPIKIEEINIDMPCDQVKISPKNKTDPLLSACIEANGQKISLIDLTNAKKLSELLLEESPKALYFPSIGHKPCCDKKENWLLLSTIKSKLYYISIENSQMTIEKDKSIELFNNKNLHLENLFLNSIAGGIIYPDESNKDKTYCNRQVFFAAGYAQDPLSLKETEGHGYMCEGDTNAARLGDKID